MKLETYNLISSLADEYALGPCQLSTGEYVLFGFEQWKELESFLKEPPVQGLRLRPVLLHQDGDNLWTDDATVTGPLEFSASKWGSGCSVFKHWDEDKETQFLNAYIKPWIDGYMRSENATIHGLSRVLVNAKEIWEELTVADDDEIVITQTNNGIVEYCETMPRNPMVIRRGSKMVAVALI